PAVNKGVEFVHVPEGVFDGAISKEGHSGTRRNDIEAKRVAEVCAKYASEYPDKSIGVIAFSRSQEVAIRDAIIELLRTTPGVREKLNEDDASTEAFFIKNLESVQGDERDIIILSIGYAKDKNGQVHNRFGPINGKNGYRRLNVAFTRAKEKVACVSSLKASELKPGENVRGTKMLQRYLEYAERGRSALISSMLVQNTFVEADSPFELDVEKALKDRGYGIERQVGASGYKIDLAVIDPRDSGKFILGIECDGATYHSDYSARVNDRLRQEILERLGWKIYRIWSQHWIYHKKEVVDDIIKAINKN
ncbi:MAG: AAA domain-containing protein, partial [Chlamydiota bacterium]|nr:AAA domain-containing protein [Chlamydiota bacterium]